MPSAAVMLRVELFCDEVDVDAVTVVLGEPVTETFATAQGEPFPDEYQLPLPAFANTCDFWGQQVTASDDAGGTITNQAFRPLVRLTVRDTDSDQLADGVFEGCEVSEVDDFGTQARTAICPNTFLTLIDVGSASVTAKFATAELACGVDREGLDGPAVLQDLVAFCRDLSLMLVQ